MLVGLNAEALGARDASSGWRALHVAGGSVVFVVGAAPARRAAPERDASARGRPMSLADAPRRIPDDGDGPRVHARVRHGSGRRRPAASARPRRAGASPRVLRQWPGRRGSFGLCCGCPRFLTSGDAARKTAGRASFGGWVSLAVRSSRSSFISRLCFSQERKRPGHDGATRADREQGCAGDSERRSGSFWSELL